MGVRGRLNNVKNSQFGLGGLPLYSFVFMMKSINVEKSGLGTWYKSNILSSMSHKNGLDDDDFKH